MTRFLYIADTHLGASPVGYHQQPGYPERLTEILSALCECLEGVDFILHGGDMINLTTDANILAAVAAFDLPVPVYLCLGNHDLTVPDAVERWMELAPGFFMGGEPNTTIRTEDCVIHVAPNHWGDAPFYWKDKQDAHLSAVQIERLAHELGIAPRLPHVILTHSSVHGLPTEQTGFPEPYHSPTPSFTRDVSAFLEQHANVTCVLGAHNHMNMRVHQDGVEFVTVSSLVETPFEFKLFEVTPDSFTMATEALNASLDFGGDYDATRPFVQGRAVDRAFGGGSL